MISYIKKSDLDSKELMLGKGGFFQEPWGPATWVFCKKGDVYRHGGLEGVLHGVVEQAVQVAGISSCHTCCS